jgi:hypothetical protein
MTPRVAVVAAVFLALGAPAALAQMKDELKLAASGPGAVRTRFGVYGPGGPQAILAEKGGLRFRLPARAGGVAQTGLYSYFALSGDAEASFAYELVSLPTPLKGYGSGVGLAFDAGDEVGRGCIQRVHKPTKESGYVLQAWLPEPGGKMKEEYRFVATAAKRGWIGLRREKKELVFLASDELGKSPEEIGRLPFTERTIRAVRLFADAGGSPTALDVRASEVHVRAEEITARVPRRERPSRWWLWRLAAAPCAGLLAWGWRSYRKRPARE